MLRERLLPLPGGRLLALTLDAGLDHEPPTRQLNLAYARVLLPSGARHECFDLISEPLAADPRQAAELERTANGQLEVAALNIGKTAHAQYLDNAARYRWRARQARTASRLLPVAGWSLGDGRVLLGYQLHRKPRWFRVLCLDSMRELYRFDGTDLCALVDRPAPTDTAASTDAIEVLIEHVHNAQDLGEAEQLALAQALQQAMHAQAQQQSIDVLPMKICVIGANDDAILVDAGMERFIARHAASGMQRLESVPTLFGAWPVSAPTRAGFAFEVQQDMGSFALLCTDATSGAETRRWPRKKQFLGSIAGTWPASDMFVVGAFGGEIMVFDAATDSIDRIPPFLGMGKDDFAEVAISPCARHVAVFTSLPHARLGLFDRHTRRCTLLDMPRIDVRPSTTAGEPDQQRLPDILLADGDALILACGEITQIAFDGLSWTNPPAPPPKFKKLASPPATLDAATERGPLAPIKHWLRGLYAPGVALRPTRQRKDLPTGSSKFNGLPDLAHGAAWPRWRNTPMAFMAQINLADAHQIAPDLTLPSTGLLSFFLGLDPEYPVPSFFGEVNTDRRGATVIYTPAGTALDRLRLPEDMPAEFTAIKQPVCALTMTRAGGVLPELHSPAMTLVNLLPEQAQAYEALANVVNGNRDSRAHWGSRLGGQPAILQADSLQYDAENLERGNYGDPASYAQWQQPEFQRLAQRWGQLLQMAEGAEGWSWGDAGLLHWMVQRGEMASARFESVWTVGVCH